MRDPVTGFLYPAKWVEKASDPAGLALVADGFAVLTASGAILRRGYTTGTTAAAACKAAILSLSGDIAKVSIKLPCGLVADLPVAARAGRASCRKYARRLSLGCNGRYRVCGGGGNGTGRPLACAGTGDRQVFP